MKNEIKILLILIGLGCIQELIFLSIVLKYMPDFKFYPIWNIYILLITMFGISVKRYLAWILGILIFGISLLTNELPMIIIGIFYKTLNLTFFRYNENTLKLLITFF